MDKVEEKLYQGKVKYMAYADMRMKGMTCKEIGNNLPKKVSRQRVHHVLKVYFSELDFPVTRKVRL